MKDYFKILGVSWLANDAEIKKAYRKLVLQYHPDKNSSTYATTIFMEIQEAYDVLGNSISRNQYIYQYKVTQQQKQTLQQTVSTKKEAPLYQKVKYKASNNEYTRKEIIQITTITFLVLLIIIAFSVVILKYQKEQLEKENIKILEKQYSNKDWLIIDSNNIKQSVSEEEIYQILQKKYGLTKEQIQQIIKNRKQ